MPQTRNYSIVGLIFTPMIIVLLLLGIIAFSFPYDYYFKGPSTTNLLVVIFPIALVILLPIDLIIKFLLWGRVKRIWIIECVGLVLSGFIFWIFTR